MIISVEISYYPLNIEIDKPIKEFIDKITEDDNISVQTGSMSSTLTGEFNNVMSILNEGMRYIFNKYPSVFNLKISNVCQVK